MTTKSYLRGHEIYFKNGTWFYCDNDKPTHLDPMRKCGYCNLPNRNDDIDPCLGKLQGVRNACCGHGDPKLSYIQFKNGVTVRNFIKD